MRRSDGRGIVFSLLEFDVLWEELGAGDPPYPLDVPSHGVTLDQRDAFASMVDDELERHGLLDGDEPIAPLADAFGVLADSQRSLDLVVVGLERLRAVACSSGAAGVFAGQDEGEIAVEPIGGDAVVPAMLAVIGEVPGGPGSAVSVPRDVFEKAMSSFAEHGVNRFEATLTAGGLTGRALRPMLTMVTADRTVAGQFGATVGGRRSAVLSWVDTAEGRYAMVVDDAGVQPWVTVAPAHPGWLSDRLHELVSTVD